MNQPNLAEFNGTQLKLVDHVGQKWLTAEEVGRCLGYDPSNARKGVLKMYERHGDEFTEHDTGVVKLTTPGGLQSTRIFSATGCIKLGFFANTPRAVEFRTWASKVLAAREEHHVIAHETHLNLAREIGVLRDQLLEQNRMMLALFERLTLAQRGQIRAQDKLTRVIERERNMLARQEKAQARETILKMEADGVPRDVICITTGRTLNHVRQVIWQAKRDGVFPQKEVQHA